MTPNLFLATQTLVKPHRWFRRKHSVERAERQTEHWDSPVPGLYEYIPGRGWFLVATVSTDSDEIYDTLARPQPVTYSKVLRRYLLRDDYNSRKVHGRITDAKGKAKDVGFFRLDDGIAWVNCWDEYGQFIPGPWEQWCIDTGTGHFRKMLKGDNPEWRIANGSRTASVDLIQPPAQGMSSNSSTGGYISKGSTRPSSVRGMSGKKDGRSEASSPNHPCFPRSPNVIAHAGELEKKLRNLHAS